MSQISPTISLTAPRVAEPTTQDLTRLRAAAGQAVGATFFGTLLQMMRNNPFQGKYGHGGRGEEAFAGQLHGLLAERMGGAVRRGPAEAVYQHLEKQQRLISQVRSGEGKEPV